MRLSRRQFIPAGLVLAATLPSVARTAPARPRPIVIAHRGASGERPEESASAYRLAIAEGADFIEPDLVATKDGVLVARHENEIGGTTDVGGRPEFAARRTAKVIDGAPTEGWFTEDFTLAELKTLRVRERLPQLRPASASHDGEDLILTFQEVIDIARLGGLAARRTVGVYPEMKHPTHFAAAGLPLEVRLAEALKRNGLDSATAPVFVQCFEVGALKTFRTLSRARLVQLVDSTGAPADFVARGDPRTYADMISPAGMKAIAAYADGIGPDKSLVVSLDVPGIPPTPLVRDAHAAGLLVHPWTVRAENAFLPQSLKRGPVDDPALPGMQGNVDALFAALYGAGVDGLFSDFPGLAVAARSRISNS